MNVPEGIVRSPLKKKKKKKVSNLSPSIKKSEKQHTMWECPYSDSLEPRDQIIMSDPTYRNTERKHILFANVFT